GRGYSRYGALHAFWRAVHRSQNRADRIASACAAFATARVTLLSQRGDCDFPRKLRDEIARASSVQRTRCPGVYPPLQRPNHSLRRRGMRPRAQFAPFGACPTGKYRRPAVRPRPGARTDAWTPSHHRPDACAYPPRHHAEIIVTARFNRRPHLTPTSFTGSYKPGSVQSEVSTS